MQLAIQRPQRALAGDAWAGYVVAMDDARRIAAFVDDALHGPWGPLPLQRVVARHLDLFHELRDLGVPWPAVAKRFADAGLDKPATWWRAAYSTAASRARQRQARSERAPVVTSSGPQTESPPAVVVPARSAAPVDVAAILTPHKQGLESLVRKKPPPGG